MRNGSDPVDRREGWRKEEREMRNGSSWGGGKNGGDKIIKNKKKYEWNERAVDLR